ncbi:MAG: DUF1570 domain-containing protein [Planctomycetota bacterium]
MKPERRPRGPRIARTEPSQTLCRLPRRPARAVAERWHVVACWCLALAALLAPAAAAQDAELRSFQSRHYLIHTDLERDEVVEFGRHMDAVFAEFERRFDGFRNRRRAPMPLYLFSNEDGYRDYLAKLDIDATNSGGMFFVRPQAQGLATWVGGKSTTRTQVVLQHEGFHQFAWSYIGRDLPVWINEGLAQYFEDGIFTGRRMRTGMADARRIAMVRNAIETEQAIPLEQIVSLTGQAWSDTLATDPQRSSLLYAQSWSIVYYLVHGRDGRYRAAFQRYLQLVSEGRRSDQAMRQAFGVESLAGIDAQWRAYALAQEPDPVTAAAERLDFFGVAMAYIKEQGEEIPDSFEAFQSLLSRRSFALTRSSHGLTHEISAADPEVFTFTRPGGVDAPFRMLAPARDDLPPRIEAPGLRPEPRLEWSRDSQGQLVYEIEYR